MRPTRRLPALTTLCPPSGLFSFASTTLILSLYNADVRGIGDPNVVVGMALFVGGLGQLLAGMWEFACGNSFGATGESRSLSRASTSSPRPLLRTLPWGCRGLFFERKTPSVFRGQAQLLVLIRP